MGTSMSAGPRVLLQCSIPYAADDWHVGRFSLLAEELGRWARVTAGNREPDGPDGTGSDPVLAGLDRSRFDAVWLMGVDGGTALTAPEIAAINRFQREGGGLLTARDHFNMGLWLRGIEGAGSAHFFHEASCAELDESRRARDDRETLTIDFPNYHSGRNGDVQPVAIPGAAHPLMRNPGSASGRIEVFPSHPHEGAVGVPAGEPRARAVATGRSTVTGRDFALVVAFDRTATTPGRAIAESSFHHFVDYNWDIARGAPSFVTEAPGDAIRRRPELLDDVRAYVKNCVTWLAPGEA
jgi:hypothetical protein